MSVPRINTSKSRPLAASAGELLAKVPRKPLTPEQQLSALNKVQAQATQRIKLGQQLFKAAEARLTQHQDILDQVKAEQTGLREQIQDDVAKSLQGYDQWMGKIDESFTHAVRGLTSRLDQVEQQMTASQGEMQHMVARAAALMEQTQNLLAETFGDDLNAQAIESLPMSMAEEPLPQPEGHDDLAEITDEFIEPDQPAQAPAAPKPSDGHPLLSLTDMTSANGEAPLPNAPAEMPMMPEESPEEQEDVFSQVLDRLRDQEAEDGENAAA